MEFFQCKDSYNIGLEELDRQHRSFLQMVNTCLDENVRIKPKVHRFCNDSQDSM